MSVRSNISDGKKYSYRDKPHVFILDSREEKQLLICQILI